MKIVTVVAFLGMVVAVVGCEKKAAKPDPSPTPSPTPSIDPKTIDAIELLSPGSAPTRLLRYHLTKGATAPLELAMELDLDVGSQQTGGKLPTLVMSLSILVEDVLPDGAAKIKTTVEKAHVKEREGATSVSIPVAAVANMTQLLTGMMYTATLSPDGKLRDTTFASSQSDPMAKELSQFTQGLEQIAMRMPAIPVGVGAKWSSRKSSMQNDLAMTTVTTIEITAIDGDKVSFTSASTVSAPDQTVKQGAVRADIRDIGGGGNGKGTVDLSKMTMTGEVTAEFRGTMISQDSTGNLRIAMKMTMQ